MTRVYVPTTLSGLHGFLDAGSVEATVGYAVTPALREWYVEGDARRAGVRSRRRGGPRLAAAAASRPSRARRVVLAVEVADGAARPAPDMDRAAVRLSGAVPCRPSTPPSSTTRPLRTTYAGLWPRWPQPTRATRTPRFMVDAVEDHELGWYAVQELSALVALEA